VVPIKASRTSEPQTPGTIFKEKHIFCSTDTKYQKCKYVTISKGIKRVIFVFDEIRTLLGIRNKLNLLYVQVTVHRDKFRIKQSQVGTEFQPDSARKRSHNLHETYQLSCVQQMTPDDGHRRCPKYVVLWQNKFWIFDASSWLFYTNKLNLLKQSLSPLGTKAINFSWCKTDFDWAERDLVNSIRVEKAD
jgi:hypothetical protein